MDAAVKQTRVATRFPDAAAWLRSVSAIQIEFSEEREMGNRILSRLLMRSA
jgi:hypothetical protein